jgi:hypothetical protein
MALEHMAKFNKFLPLIDSGELIEQYKRRVSIYLIEYSKLVSSNRMFGMDTCANIPKRVGIILQFLRLSCEYVEISWECSFNMEKFCPMCYSTLKKYSTILVCEGENCSFSCKKVKVPTVKIENGRLKSESTYKASKNYKKELMHLCGLVHSCKDDEINDIRSYLYKAGIHDPTHAHIRMAIHACGYNNYNDTNYIYSEIT